MFTGRRRAYGSRGRTVKTKRALILKMGAIGDVAMIIPVAAKLRDEGFEIHWICGKVVRPLLECYPWITLIEVDEKAIMVGKAFQRIRSVAKLWSKVGGRHYNLCGVLNYDWRYRALMLPVRADRKLGLMQAARSQSPVPGRSCTDEFARLLLGREDKCCESSLGPVAPELLPPSPLPPSAGPRRIALVPGGASNFHLQLTLRRWPAPLYADLAGRLQRRGWEVVLLGAPEDEWVRPYFREFAVTDCIGKLSIPEVVSVCDECDAVVSHDTGPMHLAGMSRACLVAIFGPTNPGHFLPRRPGVVGIWGGQGFACRPCHDGRSFAPCEFAGCMHQVAPDLVLQQLDLLFEARMRGHDRPWQLVFPTPV